MSLYHAGQSKALWSHSRKQFVFIHGKKGRLQQGGGAEDTERAPQDSAVCVRGQSGGGGEGRRGSSFWKTILTQIFQVFFFFFPWTFNIPKENYAWIVVLVSLLLPNAHTKLFGRLHYYTRKTEETAPWEFVAVFVFRQVEHFTRSFLHVLIYLQFSQFWKVTLWGNSEIIIAVIVTMIIKNAEDSGIISHWEFRWSEWMEPPGPGSGPHDGSFLPSQWKSHHTTGYSEFIPWEPVMNSKLRM